ncbi:Pectate lyase [Psidium guajava]|nr:Pectate lyase [Psidium guajava]
MPGIPIPEDHDSSSKSIILKAMGESDAVMGPRGIR